ncbi:MAG: bifunctional hydroxymethylpyrimidine kinase/phosphomethylpyrimidine kinase [Wolinella sp.]
MKVILSIAGSDSSGGAGIQADIKSAEAFGCFCTTALTIATAQNTLGVCAIKPMGAQFVRAQIDSVIEDFRIAAIKIGMLYDTETIIAVGEFLLQNSLQIPVVLDPVAVSQAGSKLLQDEAIENLKDLFSLSTLITPNLRESALFWGLDTLPSIDDIHEIGKRESKKYDTAIVVKNLHKEDRSVDYLICGDQISSYGTPYVEDAQTHGTGCSFSTAIACGLALGFGLDEAVYRAKEYIYHAIANAPMIGKGVGPIMHRIKAL